jgi:hypothetical protein
MEAIMRRLIATGFICTIATMCVCTFLTIRALDSIADTLDKAESAQTITYEQPVVEDVTYEEPEEEIVVPVVYEKEASGSSIYTFGNMTDKFYLTIMINEEQGLYVYDAPNMCENRIYCDSLAELEEWKACHLDQAWHDARFVMEWRY